jgi:tetratricopeptide (TPR) repeat protein
MRSEKEDCRIAGIKSVIFMERGEEDESIYWGKRKIQIAEQLHDLILQSQAIGTLGVIYNELGRHDRAISIIHEKLRLSRLTGEHSGVTVAIDILANIYEAYGEYEKATACYLFCIDHAYKEGDTRHAAALTGYLARSLTQQGDLQAALPIMTSCIANLRKLNISGYFLINSLYNLALLHEKQNRNQESLEAADEALQLASHIECKLPQFKLDLLMLTLQAKLRHWEPGMLQKKFDQLHTQALPAERQAELNYVMWKVGVASPEVVKETATMYNAMYAKNPIEAYRRKYCELSGLSLPKQSIPIELPDEVKSTSISLALFIQHLKN